MFCIQCLLYFVCFVAIHGKFEYPIINIGEVSLSPTASSTWKGYNVFATYSYEDGETIDLTCHHPRSKLLLAYTSTEGAESVYVNDYNIVNFMKRMTPNNHREHIDCCLIVWKIDHFFCQVIYRVIFELKRNFTEYARISIGGVDLVPIVKSTVWPLYVTASYFFWDGEIIDLTCYYPGENLTLKYFFTSVISTVNARSTVNFLTRMSSNDSEHIISCASRLFTYTVSFRLKETPAYNVTESDSSMTTEYAKSPNDESKDKHRGEDGVMIVVGCVIAIVLFLGVISIFIIKRCYKKINTAVKAQDDYVEPETFLNSRLPGSDSTYANISSSAPPMLNTNLFNEEMYAQPLKKSER